MNAPAEEAVPAGKLRSVVTHLAMEAPPTQALPPPPEPGIAIARRQAMPAADYLRLYHAIGDDWLWWSRLTMDEPTLTTHLAADEAEVYVAAADGEEIGLFELNLRPAPDIELRYLGVIPSRIGTGLGGWLLAYAIAAASRHRPPPHDRQHLHSGSPRRPRLLPATRLRHHAQRSRDRRRPQARRSPAPRRGTPCSFGTPSRWLIGRPSAACRPQPPLARLDL